MNKAKLVLYKALTYKMGTFVILVTIAYWRTHDILTALVWGIGDLGIKMVWFTAHEALWTHYGSKGKHVMLEQLTLDQLKTYINTLPHEDRFEVFLGIRTDP